MPNKKNAWSSWNSISRKDLTKTFTDLTENKIPLNINLIINKTNNIEGY